MRFHPNEVTNPNDLVIGEYYHVFIPQRSLLHYILKFVSIEEGRKLFKVIGRESLIELKDPDISKYWVMIPVKIPQLNIQDKTY